MAEESGLPVTQWRDVQTACDVLWNVVLPTAIYERPVPERHRLIFYLGHLEAFDWNLLAPPLGLKPFHPEWDRLFAFGIDPVAGDLPRDQPNDWPAIAEVSGYQTNVRQRLLAALQHAARDGGASPAASDLGIRLRVALEHRWMHVETLSYLFHNLAYEHKQPRHEDRDRISNANRANADRPGKVVVPAGAVTLGQVRGDAFGWDNEFDAHSVPVRELSVDRYKITNDQYRKFVDAGAPAPHFWGRRDGNWTYHGMFAEMPLPPDAPVYVTQAEAAAYAEWSGQALPSEAEWQRLAYGAPDGSERAFPWGGVEVRPEHGNFDFQRWEPDVVTAHPSGASAWGVEDLLGNGWEWTSTRFGPFAGFRPMPFYPGYSANFFDDRHYVMKGASARTAACFLRRSFRNWFQPHYPFVYAGFRCVSRA